MEFISITGRVLGSALLTFALSFSPIPVAAASGNSEVSVENKRDDSPNFSLSDYEQDLLQCSALSAIHMWIEDSIGFDEGSEVRKAIGEDYWLKVSKEYLSLAEQASGGDDLSEEVGVEIRSLAAEWRRLTETEVSDSEWISWNNLIDNCESWRSDRTARSFNRKDLEPVKEKPRVVTVVADTNL